MLATLAAVLVVSNVSLTQRALLHALEAAFHLRGWLWLGSACWPGSCSTLIRGQNVGVGVEVVPCGPEEIQLSSICRRLQTSFLSWAEPFYSTIVPLGQRVLELCVNSEVRL